MPEVSFCTEGHLVVSPDTDAPSSERFRTAPNCTGSSVRSAASSSTSIGIEAQDPDQLRAAAARTVSTA